MNTQNFKKIRLGKLLVDQGYLSEEQLQQAVLYHQKKGVKIGQAVVALKMMTQDSVLEVLSKQMGVECLTLDHYDLDKELISKIPEAMARRFTALVVAKEDNKYKVAFSDPSDILAKDEIARRLGGQLIIGIASEEDILLAIDQYYRKNEVIIRLSEQLQSQLGGVYHKNQGSSSSLEATKDFTVTRLLCSIFEDALQIHASDVHLEPEEEFFRIRLRVDGVLHEQVLHEIDAFPAIVSRLKMMAQLNILEKRLPQDGRFSIEAFEREIDVRVSILPINNGESVVMRLLDKSHHMFTLSSLGLKPEVKNLFVEQLAAPYGLILVTGPTGSGKSSTLYAFLQHLNTQERKIITAEDPIEYSIERVNQVQAHEEIGLTFADILRSALRQDPDVVMVGEIRDFPTAQMTLQASLTGHLVLSTLHTNTALGAPERLVNIGIEPFLVAATLKLVISQRLIRKLCNHCAEPYELSAHDKVALRQLLGPAHSEKGSFKKAKGCYQCAQTGYRGRLAIYEYCAIDTLMAEQLRQQNFQAFYQRAHECGQYKPLGLAAFEEAQEGGTSLEEVFKVCIKEDLPSTRGDCAV